MFAFNSATNRWHQVGELAIARGCPCVVPTCSSSCFIVGGSTSSTEFNDDTLLSTMEHVSVVTTPVAMGLTDEQLTWYNSWLFGEGTLFAYWAYVHHHPKHRSYYYDTCTLQLLNSYLIFLVWCFTLLGTSSICFNSQYHILRCVLSHSSFTTPFSRLSIHVQLIEGSTACHVCVYVRMVWLITLLYKCTAVIIGDVHSSCCMTQLIHI